MSGRHAPTIEPRLLERGLLDEIELVNRDGPTTVNLRYRARTRG